VLRKEWGFKGFVVSDYYAIWELSYRPDAHGHSVAKDKKEACELAVKAGVNIELPDPDCYLHLVELVRRKVLQESQLDELVAPMLFWKFKLGLFGNPYVDVGNAEHHSRRNRTGGSNEFVDEVLQEFLAAADVRCHFALLEHVGFKFSGVGPAGFDPFADARIP
jgi:beta-glucosidase-like glycosyl hydrolase